MNPEIEKLIKMALADGQITDKEREIILRKAEKQRLARQFEQRISNATEFQKRMRYN